jgi:hypothetical protein
MSLSVIRKNLDGSAIVFLRFQPVDALQHHGVIIVGFRIVWPLLERLKIMLLCSCRPAPPFEKNSIIIVSFGIARSEAQNLLIKLLGIRELAA